MELVVVQPVYILWRRIARSVGRSPHYSFGKVNLISAAGISGMPNRLPYAASKHGIVGITQMMALELGPLAVRVDAVVPRIHLRAIATLVSMGNVSPSSSTYDCNLSSTSARSAVRTSSSALATKLANADPAA